MSAVAEHMAAELAICHEVRIDRILRTNEAWELTDDTGRRFGSFDFLVLSLPAPQSAVLLGPHSFAAEAAGVTMAPCWAALVAFKDRLDVLWDGAFVSNSPHSWVARNSSKPGRPRGADCWVLHASPEWSATHLEESPKEVGPQLLDAFEAIVGCSLPKVHHLAAHRWRHSSGADPSGLAVLFDAKAGLVVCGDWLSGGRVEGAFHSGTEGAVCILREVSIPNLLGAT
jgi:predicted NAD/FAD-dependent oxidoreductase